MNPFTFLATLVLLIFIAWGLVVVVSFASALLFPGRDYLAAAPPPAPHPIPPSEEDPDAPPYTYEAVANWIPSRIRADIESAVTETRKRTHA